MAYLASHTWSRPACKKPKPEPGSEELTVQALHQDNEDVLGGGWGTEIGAAVKQKGQKRKARTKASKKETNTCDMKLEHHEGAADKLLPESDVHGIGLFVDASAEGAQPPADTSQLSLNKKKPQWKGYVLVEQVVQPSTQAEVAVDISAPRASRSGRAPSEPSVPRKRKSKAPVQHPGTGIHQAG